MMNCVHPQCTYRAPQNRPTQMTNHMAKAHGVQYQKGSTNLFTPEDARMLEVDKDRVCNIVKETVIGLLRENYNCAIEVDGLICISVINSKEQHVVKMHQLLPENTDLFTNSKIVQSNNQTTVSHDIRYTPETNSLPLFVQNTSANNQSDKKPFTVSSGKKKALHPLNDSATQVASENSARFPFLVQTLKENRKNGRAASSSPSFSAANQNTLHRNSLLGNLVSNSPLNSDRSASSLLQRLSSQKQQQEQFKVDDNRQQFEVNDNSDHFKQNENTEDFVLSVKKEPVFEEMGDQAGKEGSSGQEKDQAGDVDSSGQNKEKSETVNVKSEPFWNESEYGGHSNPVGQSDGDSNTDSQTGGNSHDSVGNSNDTTSTTTKSILANILKGREESYTKSRDSFINLSFKENSVKSVKQKGTSAETCNEDIPLLYRLPFTAFQDLIPGGQPVETPTSQQTESNFSEPACSAEEKAKSGNAVNLEVFMRKMLEDPDKKKRPQRKRKSNVSYSEMEDFSSGVDYSDEDYESPVIDNDDIYVPSGKDVTSENDEPEFTMSLRRKKPRKTRKRAVAIKSTTKNSKSNENAKDPRNCDQALYRYACSHCQIRFKDRVKRDNHEEENCVKELIVCEICKGFFANTSARNKHLWEVHTILSDEQKEEIIENRQSALQEFKKVEQVDTNQRYEFETLREEENSEAGIRIESITSVSEFEPQFDLEASSTISDSEKILVTKFIVPFSKKNANSFIKCPLCINLFSDLASKDEHLRKKHKIANQIDNDDGTVSLQVLEKKPSNTPPVFVKFEQSKQ